MRSLIFLLAASVLISPVEARVTRIEIESRQDVLNGRAFDHAGPYELLTGRVYFSVKVDNPHNTRIVDLRNSVNLRKGEVQFSADFQALRPRDAAKANGSLLLEIPNRGHTAIVYIVDGGDRDVTKDPGDAWLLRNGFTVVSLGWQWDATAPGELRLYAPVAKGPHDTTLTGLIRGDVMPSRPMDDIPLGHLIRGTIGGEEYPAAAPEDSRNTLSVRDSRTAVRQVIPASQWSFAQTLAGKVVPNTRFIHLNGGFQPGKLYEYVYVAANPVVAGLGLAAVRDFASYVKHDSAASIHATRVYGEGISQNGRFLRDFIYEGFNADEEGGKALDGVLAHVAGAGRGSFNYRFAQPSRDSQPTSSVFFPTDVFPFTDLPEKDPISAEQGGLLDRATADRVVPKIFFSNTSYEYWGRAAALIHVKPDASGDAPISPDVRVYHFTGLQHFSGPFPPARGEDDLLGRAPQSALPVKYFWRAMITNMDAWARAGTAPPESRYPKLADRTLVRFEEYTFPTLPGVEKPREATEAFRIDFGPRWRDGILTLQPPKVGQPFPVLVPHVDADGNEMDGVRLPEITVPLATYAAWNLRDPSIGAPTQRVAFEGSYLPFPRTSQERATSGDPRKSIAERYSGREDYLDRFGRALDALIQERWILAEDRAALLERGGREWDDAISSR